MPVDYKQIPHVLTFRGQYGRLCALAAQALEHRNCSTDAVRHAMGGEGDYVQLAALREQRAITNRASTSAAVALRGGGMSSTETTKLLIAVAREAKHAVESEWSLRLPIVRVR